MDFLRTLRFGEVLRIDTERYMVVRTWNGKTVQVRRKTIKHSQSLKPSEVSEYVELYNPKYGYSAKRVADIVVEPYAPINQWTWDGNDFTLKPVADTTPASEENAPSSWQVPPFLLG